MGVASSKCRQDFEKKLDHTKTTAARVIAEYEASYLRPEFCDRVTAFEAQSEKMVTLPDMANAAQTLGIAVGDADTVKRICGKIRTHFERRKRLIIQQMDTINLAESWIDAVMSGEYCAPVRLPQQELTRSKTRGACPSSTTWVEPIPADVDQENSAWLSEVSVVCGTCQTLLSNADDTLSDLLAGKGVVQERELVRLEARAKADQGELTAAFERFMSVTKDMRVSSVQETAAAKITQEVGNSFLAPLE